LVRSRRKRRGNVYRTDFSRISVYPKYQKPHQDMGPKKIEPGDEMRVRVSGLDDDGRPTAIAKGYTIVIEGIDLEPGENVRVVVERVEGRTAYARLKEE